LRAAVGEAIAETAAWLRLRSASDRSLSAVEGSSRREQSKGAIAVSIVFDGNHLSFRS
jgi:hypothetical protein